jgi:hypothetical protein
MATAFDNLADWLGPNRLPAKPRPYTNERDPVTGELPDAPMSADLGNMPNTYGNTYGKPMLMQPNIFGDTYHGASGEWGPKEVLAALDKSRGKAGQKVDVSEVPEPNQKVGFKPADVSGVKEKAPEESKFKFDPALATQLLDNHDRGMAHLAAILHDANAAWIPALKGTKADTAYDAEQNAGQGMKDLQTRQNMARQKTADEVEQFDLKGKKEAQDPFSEKNKRLAAAALADGFITPEEAARGVTPDMIEWKKQGRILKQGEKESDRKTAAEAATAAESKRWHDLEHQDRQAEIAARREREGAPKSGVKMTADLLQKNSGADLGADEVMNQARLFNKVGGIGLVGQDSANYKKSSSGAMTIAAGINPLARESLAAKMDTLGEEYLPAASDTKQSGMTKLYDHLRRMHQGLEGRIRAFDAAGTDTTPLQNELEHVKGQEQRFQHEFGKYLPKEYRQPTKGEANSASQEAPAAHPQDNEAVQWAKAHPGTPESAQILKLNGY